MIFKSFWFWFITIFIAIQFVTVDVPSKVESDPKLEIEAPKEVMALLKRSCYDCHSNKSTYPWYDRVAPVSWVVKNHVKNGRKVVNFSLWKSYEKKKQNFFADKLEKSVIIRMPLPSYLWLHPNAKLSNENKKLLKHWANILKEEIK